MWTKKIRMKEIEVMSPNGTRDPFSVSLDYEHYFQGIAMQFASSGLTIPSCEPCQRPQGIEIESVQTLFPLGLL